MSDESPLADFAGKARLFPLPNLVFFPQVMQPLHIFEPRYRQMTADALEGDRLIALVLPKPGWEGDYMGKPALHSVACIGRIVAEQSLEDGRYNFLLRGVARVRIVSEIASKKLYRTARVEILQDTQIADETKCESWRSKLLDKTPSWFQAHKEMVEQFRKLLLSDLSLGAVCDILAFALPLDSEFKQSLLEELNVETRLAMLHDFMESQTALNTAMQRKFPPEFSMN
jgi:Lon protease-like protein